MKPETWGNTKRRREGADIFKQRRKEKQKKIKSDQTENVSGRRKETAAKAKHGSQRKCQRGKKYAAVGRSKDRQTKKVRRHQPSESMKSRRKNEVNEVQIEVQKKRNSDMS